eukprot:5176247-Prymnesium_polylepis.1
MSFSRSALILCARRMAACFFAAHSTAALERASAVIAIARSRKAKKNRQKTEGIARRNRSSLCGTREAGSSQLST